MARTRKAHALSLLAMLLAGAFLDAQPERFLREHGGNPFTVTVATGGRTNDYRLLGLEERELVLQPIDGDADARVLLPLDDMDEFTLTLQLPNRYDRARENLDLEQYDRAAALYRPIGWSLAPYTVLSSDTLNVHDGVTEFFRALVGDRQFEEAFALVQAVDIPAMPPAFLNEALGLVKLLVAEGATSDAINLLVEIPLAVDQYETLQTILAFAGELRVEDKLEEALAIYQRIVQLGDTDWRREAMLWSAYCHVRLNRVETARLLLGEMGEVKPRDPVFSLYQLVLGRIHFQRENYRAAMQEISQGVVFAKVGYAWVPELFFVSGVCYHALGSPDIAGNVFDQMALFFPADTWTDRAREFRRESEPASDAPPSS
ncbi:MAG: tetratricopeptide repeat protein [Opitutales bacterium]